MLWSATRFASSVLEPGQYRERYGKMFVLTESTGGALRETDEGSVLYSSTWCQHIASDTLYKQMDARKASVNACIVYR